MNIEEQIENFIISQPEPTRSEIHLLHLRILQILPGCKQWFDDGRNNEKKIVSNPTIGYGRYIMKYADGSTKAFFQVGLSANKTGISIYILGIKDKAYLAQTFGEKIGKAKVTGYCIRFKNLNDINIDILEEAILYGVNVTGKN